jgi:hypothetical protein
VLTIAALGKGGKSKPFRLDVLVPVQSVQSADERTRTAGLISLRVISQALQGCAQGCKCRISKGILFSRLPTIAGYCVRVRVKLGSSVVSTP